MALINSINTYLKKLSIYIDIKEFQLQIKSHPDFPSLLSVTDTLTFFDVTNKVYNIDKSDFQFLPNKFIARVDKETKKFVYVEKKEDKYKIYDSNRIKTISEIEFETLFDDIVLFIDEKIIPSKKDKRVFKTNVPIIIIASILFITSFWNILAIKDCIFILSSLIGFYLSLIALKKVFNISNPILDKLCNISTDNSCDEVINSKKWILFNKINFSDISILFFTTQIATFFFHGLRATLNEYYYIQSNVLILAIPFVLVSLFFQKVIVKKWCPICLLISLLLMLQLFYVIFYKGYSSIFTTNHFVFYILWFSLFYILWVKTKNHIIENNESKQSLIELNRLVRNYQVFKNTLNVNKTYSFPSSAIKLGNANANLELTIITNPFCGHCKQPYEMLKSFLSKYENRISINIIFNTIQSEKLTQICGILMQSTNKSHEIDDYFDMMDRFYQFDDSEEWLSYYNKLSVSTDIKETLNKQSTWCSENNFTFTPCLFINGKEFPRVFKIKNLDYYIEELLDDYS